MALQFTTSYLEDSITLFRYYKKLGDGAMAQVTEEQLYAVVGPEMNSIAVIVQHLSGNMISRWTDFPNGDGEKPGRNRDAEFESPGLELRSREKILRLWEEGWECVFQALSSLGEGDMGKTITIRGEKHSVMQAINRQQAHYAYHCGQIVLLGKLAAGEAWRSLSIPRGQSAEFARRVASGEMSQR